MIRENATIQIERARATGYRGGLEHARRDPPQLAGPLRAGLAVLAAVAGLAASSCGRKPTDVIAQRRPAAEAQVARFEAVGSLLKAAAPLESDRIELSGPPPNFPPHLGKHDAVAMDAEQFGDLQASPRQFRLVAENPVADAVSLLRAGTFADGGAPHSKQVPKVEEAFDRFEALRYVLVLRTTGGREPRASGTEFTGGFWDGEALLYDLQAGSLAGGFRFHAENDDKVDVAQENVHGWLVGNLRSNALGLVRAEFERRFPEASTPFGDDEGARRRASLEDAKR